MRNASGADIARHDGHRGWRDDETSAPRGHDRGAIRGQMLALFTNVTAIIVVAGTLTFLVVEAYNQSHRSGEHLLADGTAYAARLAVLAGCGIWAAWRIAGRQAPRRWGRTVVWALTLTFLMWAAGTALAGVALALVVTIAIAAVTLLLLSVALAFIPGGHYIVYGLWWLAGSVMYLLGAAGAMVSSYVTTNPDSDPKEQSAPAPVRARADIPAFYGRSARRAVTGEIWSAVGQQDTVLVVENTGSGLLVADVTTRDRSTDASFVPVPRGSDGVPFPGGFAALRTRTLGYEQVGTYQGSPGAQFWKVYSRAGSAVSS